MKFLRFATLAIVLFLSNGCSKDEGDGDDDPGAGPDPITNPGPGPSTSTDLADRDATFATPGFVNSPNGAFVPRISSAGPGKIYVGNTKGSTYGGVKADGLCRINADGTLDQSFSVANSLRDDYSRKNVFDLKILKDGKIAIVGTFRANDANQTHNVAIISSTGALDNTFNLGGLGLEGNGVFAVEEDQNGKLLIGGYIFQYNGAFQNRNLYRFNRNGTLDQTFNIGTGFNGEIGDIKVDQNGRIWVVGRFSKFNNIDTRYMAILNPDGSLYKSFNNFLDNGTFTHGLYRMAFQKSGKVIVGGNCAIKTPSNKSWQYLARINADGTFDETWKYSELGMLDWQVRDIAVNSNDDVLIGFEGTGRVELLKADGSLHPGFIQGEGVGGTVNTVYIDENDRFYLGGIFSSYKGQAVNPSIIRLKGGK